MTWLLNLAGQELISNENLNIIENEDGTYSVTYKSSESKADFILIEQETDSIQPEAGIAAIETAEVDLNQTNIPDTASVKLESIQESSLQAMDSDAISGLNLEINDVYDNPITTEAPVQVTFDSVSFTNQSDVQIRIFESGTNTQTIENENLTFTDNGDGTFKISFQTTTTNANFIVVEEPPPTYILSGNLSGFVSGTLSIGISGGESIPLTADGNFQFTKTFLEGEIYACSTPKHYRAS